MVKIKDAQIRVRVTAEKKEELLRIAEKKGWYLSTVIEYAVDELIRAEKEAESAIEKKIKEHAGSRNER